MLGLPSPSAVANQALAGIKFAADFKPDMGFKVVAEAQTMQTALDSVMAKRKTWDMPSTGDLWFLNTKTTHGRGWTRSGSLLALADFKAP